MKLVCRQCGAQYEKGKFCLECGSPLEDVQVQKVLYCTNCQIVVESGKFCPECGTKLEEREVESPINTNSISPETVSTNITSGDEEIETILSKYRDEYGDMRTLNKEEYAVALEEIKHCVDKENIEAMCFLATFYMDGDGVPKNETVAYNLLREAENKGSEYAKAMLAIFYMKGVIVEQDIDEAINRLVNGYNKLNNPSIAGVLARLYYELNDFKKALKYATEAVEKNEMRGLVVLGSMYLNGFEFDKNEEKAFDFYMEAAAMGEETALNQIGWMYMNGIGVEKNTSQAYFWFNESAQKGSDVGMYNLACCYRDGYGVEQDIEKSTEWFKKAFEAGYVEELAENTEENLLDNANCFFESNDYKSALVIYKDLAENGNVSAMVHYGICLINGLGTKQNMKEGIDWLSKGADQGSALACVKLAEIYLGFEYNKKQLKPDSKMSRKYIELAQKYGIDTSEISDLIKMTTPSAKITGLKYMSNSIQDNTLGVEFSFELIVDGMLGEDVNVSVLNINEFTDKSVSKKPCKCLFEPIECVYTTILKPGYTSAIWKPYTFFVPYDMLCEFNNLNNTLVLIIWNQSEKKPVQLVKEEFQYELKHTKHLFRADEWGFKLLRKSK